MVISIDSQLQRALDEQARRLGVTPEEVAIAALRERFGETTPRIQPNDEWERKLLAIGSDCGVSLSDDALSRESIYE